MVLRSCVTNTLPACAASANTFLIYYASEIRHVSYLEVYAWLTPQRGFYDNVIKVGVCLKTYAHIWVICDCRRACISLAWN
jgi:hypothetical protein